MDNKEQSITNQLSTKSDEELIEIINFDSEFYTDLEVEIAVKIISERGYEIQEVEDSEDEIASGRIELGLNGEETFRLASDSGKLGISIKNLNDLTEDIKRTEEELGQKINGRYAKMSNEKLVEVYGEMVDGIAAKGGFGTDENIDPFNNYINLIQEIEGRRIKLTSSMGKNRLVAEKILEKNF
ncbi:MAG: hypothetical protein DHS20C18_54710 [Saprospiraceae bacterium]|nr:MAG: hypothetical protein DHS20C18_54710 [Saprospiraceae bacterium]